jgi:archaellum component FlaF (FlaF/FlaG flagellin family)
MSRAIASARQRRAGITQPEPPLPPSKSTIEPPAGLTLPQVIALVDTRLIKLEQFMKETITQDKSVGSSSNGLSSQVDLSNNGEMTVNLNDILDDYNNRFIILAEEISQIKDTLLKLQSYTMDVNKMLLEERVNILSDLGNDKSMFIMNNTTLPESDIDNIPETTEKTTEKTTGEISLNPTLLRNHILASKEQNTLL